MQNSQKQRQQLSLRQKSWLATRALVLQQPITDFGVLMDRFAADSVLAEKHAMAPASGDTWNGDLDALANAEESDPADTILEQLVDGNLIDDSLIECARFVISDLDANGFFTRPIAAYARTTGYTAAQVRQTLSALQSITPAGLGAKDVAHAFALQMARVLPELPVAACSRFLRTRQRAIVPSVIRTCLAKHHVEYNPEEFQRILAVLDSAPLKHISGEATRVVSPDIIIQQDELTGTLSCVVPDSPWRLEIDPAILPSARDDPEARKRIQLELTRVQWINSAISERTSVLEKLGNALIASIGEYLSGRAQQPSRAPVEKLMQATGMSRTVMVRALQRKYVRTPRGTFRLRALVLDRWETTSAPAREAVNRLLMSNPESRALSDREIAERLSAEGIHISRRTVAKYRLMIGIPSRYFRNNQ
jgi:RNA polymerase sigma-54 factor